MTGQWVFAYVALPIIVVALGYAAMRAGGRSDHHLKPRA